MKMQIPVSLGWNTDSNQVKLSQHSMTKSYITTKKTGLSALNLYKIGMHLYETLIAWAVTVSNSLPDWKAM